MNYLEYTTINNVRLLMMGSDSAARDEVLLDIIRSTSAEMDDITNRQFMPTIETRTYNTPQVISMAGYGYGYANRQGPGGDLQLDEDCLAVTTVTNGDGVAFTASQYKLFPLNSTPRQFIRVLSSSSAQWQMDSNSDPEGAISVLGIFGYHQNYADAWRATGATLSAAITTTTATTFTCTAGKLHAGELIQGNTEWMYVDSIVSGTTDTATVVRAVNGSTAATHLISTAISRWTQYDVEMVARVATVAYYRLRNNPTGETVRIGNDSFSTPKDVTAYIEKRLRNLGVIHVGIG